MPGVMYNWSKDNTYCTVINYNAKIFNIDYFPSNIDKSKYSNLFSNVRFLRYWIIPGTKSILIALRESTYLFIRDKIITFKLEPGDMIVRWVISGDNKCTIVMTRFHTLLFNEENSMYHILSKDTFRPPEFNLGFIVDESFDAKYASVWTEYNVLHDAKNTRLLLANNL